MLLLGNLVHNYRSRINRRDLWSCLAAFLLVLAPHSATGADDNTARALNTKIAQLGTTNTVVSLGAGVWNLNEDVTVPPNIKIAAEVRTKINISPGCRLILYGPFNAPMTKVFNSQGTVLFLADNQRLHPQWWGAKGNGVADDTIPFQQTLKVASESNRSNTVVIDKRRSYRITNNLFVYNKVNIVGVSSNERDSGKIILDAVPSFAEYWFNFGISYKGDSNPGHRYSGTVQNVLVQGSVNAATGRFIFYHNAQNYSLKGCTIDLTKVQSNSFYVSAVGGGNNSFWCKYSYRQDGLFQGNHVVASQPYKTGGEGIGQSNARNISVISNYIYGVGDDPIGLHDVDGGLVDENDVSSPDGRILLNNCRNFIVSNNRCTRIRDLSTGNYAAGIALIYLGHESLSANSYATPTNIVVRGNSLYYPSGNMDSGYAIYVRGGRGITIHKNRITNDNINAKYGGIHIEPFTFTGTWNDPDGIDKDNTARPSRIEIRNNLLDGLRPLFINQTGNPNFYLDPVVVQDNQAGGFDLYPTKSVVGGNEII